MKKAIFLLSFIFHAYLLLAQWTTGTGNINNTNTGNIGIGTTTPAQKLTIAGGVRVDDGDLFAGGLSEANVNGSPWLHFGNNISGEGVGSPRASGTSNRYGLDLYTAYLPRLSITNTGNVGIGTSIPAQKLTISGGLRIDDADLFSGGVTATNMNTLPWLHFGSNISGEGIGSNRPVGSTNQYGLDIYTAHTVRLSITNGGNVLIGKTSQANATYMLDIAGNARANKVVVNVTGADFVFDSAYQLPSLHKVETYIRENHHLPGIESAKQMEKDGLSIGENQTRLLQKIEELTLYLIQAQKENEALKVRIAKLENTK
jgi:hypothetical protein